MNSMGLGSILLADEGNTSETEDLSSAFKLIPLYLMLTFLIFQFFSFIWKDHYVTDIFLLPL